LEQTAQPVPVAARPVRRRSSSWRRNRAYIVGLIPAATLLSLFFLAPALWAVRASFTNRALVGIDARYPRSVGLDNYRRLLDDPNFSTVLKNSVIFVFGSAIVGQFLLGLALALLIDHGEHRGYRMTSIAYGAVLLAWVNPTIIAGFLWVAMFDFYYGSLNMLLELFGFHHVSWLGTAPMASVIAVNIWRGTAFVMIIFMGALRTIPTQIYEAARVDGAGTWQRFWDHTLPNLRHVATLTLMSITISTFGTFLLIDTLTSGGPGIQTETIALFAYHTAFKTYEIGYGSTIAVVMLAINLIFALAYLRMARPRV
jgi:multiple sugar transport system permease protein